jgi:hypothetical protein
MAVRPWMVALAWGLVSFCGFVGVLFALLPPVGQFEQLGVPHAVGLGIWALGWVLATGMLALVAARLVFGSWPPVLLAAWLVLLVGAVVSAANLWVLADWAIARYGASDPDYIGPTMGLFAVVAAVAVAGFGVQVAPRWAVWAPLLALTGGIVLAGFIFLTNVPGLANGLAPDSGPLAVVSIAAAIYVGAVAIVSAVRLRRA